MYRCSEKDKAESRSRTRKTRRRNGKTAKRTAENGRNRRDDRPEMNSKESDPNPNKNSLVREQCCKRKAEPLICNVFPSKELSLGSGSLCLLTDRLTTAAGGGVCACHGLSARNMCVYIYIYIYHACMYTYVLAIMSYCVI